MFIKQIYEKLENIESYLDSLKDEKRKYRSKVKKLIRIFDYLMYWENIVG